MSKTAIVYWSGTGNTLAMANAIAAGMEAAGAPAEIFDVSAADVNALKAYDKIAFGCPSMGSENLEEGEFEPFFTEIEGSLAGKKVALFGSYGWGDGEWMRDWAKRTSQTGATLLDDGLIANEAPDEGECIEYGKKFAAL